MKTKAASTGPSFVKQPCAKIVPRSGLLFFTKCEERLWKRPASRAEGLGELVGYLEKNEPIVVISVKKTPGGFDEAFVLTPLGLGYVVESTFARDDRR